MIDYNERRRNTPLRIGATQYCGKTQYCPYVCRHGIVYFSRVCDIIIIVILNKIIRGAHYNLNALQSQSSGNLIIMTKRRNNYLMNYSCILII